MTTTSTKEDRKDNKAKDDYHGTVHSREDIFRFNLDNYLREIAYAGEGIQREGTINQNLAFSTEYIMEKVKTIRNACIALDHDVELFQKREQQTKKKVVHGEPSQAQD